MPQTPTALLVDLYELSMVDVYRRTGMARRPATFSLFVRDLPPERGHLVAAGLDDALSWLEALRFGEEELAAVAALDAFDTEFLDWLGELRFTGDVRAVSEGTIVFGDEPILEVDAPIAEGQLAETYLLNQITLQTVLATKAARSVHAADGRPVIDFALRRTPGVDAGMKLARVGAIVGVSATSNVAGAAHYGAPVSGTMAHAFVQAHGDELDAFRAFADTFGSDTVLLVDTYDTAQGVEHAIRVALELTDRGERLRGIRLDSGDLEDLSRQARKRLDDEGLDDVAIFASGGLDEYRINDLVASGAPIDGFGVGTAIGTSSDAPSIDTVYKLVEHDGRPVRKTSTGKRTWPGAKQVWRAPDWSGDVLGLASEPGPGPDHRPLLEPVMRNGARTAAGRRSLTENAEHHARQRAAMPAAVLDLRRPEPVPVTASPGLRDLVEGLDRVGPHADEKRLEGP